MNRTPTRPVDGFSLYSLLAACLIAALSVLLSSKPARSEPVQTTGDLYKLLEPLGPNAQVRYNPSGVPLDVTVSGGVVYFAPGVPGPGPGPQPEPEPPTPGKPSLAFGNFALQPGSEDVRPVGSGRRISEAELKLPGVDGVTIRIRPQWISVNGKWDWTFPDSCVATARKANRKYTLLVMGGGQNPTSAESLNFYSEALKAIGARYGNDPLYVGVHAGAGVAPPGVSEEWHWGKMPAAAIAGAKHLIDVAAQSHPRQTIIVAGSANDPPAMQEIIRYGVQKAPGRFMFKTNAMKASTTLNWQGNQLIVWGAKNGALMGWEAVGSTKESRFGGTLQKAFDNINALTNQAGVPKGNRYFAPYPPDLSALGSIR